MRTLSALFIIALFVIAAKSPKAKYALASFTSNRATFTTTITPASAHPFGQDFAARLAASADTIGVPVAWLESVFTSESGYNHLALNAQSGAFGLIQFMPETAAWLGTSPEALALMPAADQLPFIVKYYAGQKFSSLIALRLFTFYPAAVGKPDSYQIGNRRTARQNPIYDLNGDNKITVAEFKKYYSR